jgi:hypothetical protein
MKNFKHISLGFLLLFFVFNCAFSQNNASARIPVLVNHDLIEISHIGAVVLTIPFLVSPKPLSDKFNASVLTVSRDENRSDEKSLNKKDVIIILLITLVAICCMFRLFRKD